MENPRFVSWAAVSSLPQAKKISLDDQLRTNREHIERHGGQLVAELVVPGESRSIVLFEDACRRIGAYDQLRQLIEGRAFDVLVYLDRSRLGRKASLSMAVVELCHEAGIICYETENPPARLDLQSASHDDMLIGAIKSVGAQNEVRKLVERNKMGMIARVKKGEFPKAVPWGWTAVYASDGRRQVLVDEQAADTLRLMFDLYLQGMGMNTIADELTRRGRLNRAGGAQWTVAHVKGSFGRLWRYAGYSEIRYGQQHVRAPGNWPAILSEDTVRAVQAERTARESHRRVADTPYLLSRLVVCEEHRSYLVVDHTRWRDSRYEYVCCKKCKPRRHIRTEQVLDVLRAAIEYLSSAANRAAALDDLVQNDGAIMGQIEALQKQVRQTDQAMQRADDAYVGGVMDAERYQRQVERLTTQRQGQLEAIAALQEVLAAQRFNAGRQDRLEEIANVGLDMLQSDDVAAANAWLRRHFVLYASGPSITRVDY
jgi:DNA invertase Pin-like site-specific DNA recombinase